ncbi:MAG TPA: hemerythrin domain-containing protein [Roseiarcus sp.]|nr:hemerythrin domain-containing protein [Roseiarcus sp.]
MTDAFDPQRRRFISATRAAGFVAIGGLLAPGLRAAAAEAEKSDNKEAVTPPEDLMREHGVLDRVLLIYEAGLRKFAAGQDFDPDLLTQSARIIREFIEDYHEKSEEEDVFPRFKRAGKLVGLVATLLDQHQAGRRLTEIVLRSAPASRRDEDERRKAVAAIQSFIAMYRPHAAREDTDLFPKLKALVSANEYDAVAEKFEQKERRLFGEDGFEKMVDRVAALETRMGIHDLSLFTPRT